jgi:FKBP-type peptidyl-prolyl cis-trans isomerase
VEKAAKFEFTVGGGEVIKGMDEAVKGVRVGGSRSVLVPWQLGYGRRGSPPDIPPETDLRFDLRLVAVIQRAEQ